MNFATRTAPSTGNFAGAGGRHEHREQSALIGRGHGGASSVEHASQRGNIPEIQLATEVCV